MSRTFLQFFIRVVLYTLLGFLALDRNPFGISEKADQATQDAFYRFMAPFYGDPSVRDQIVVVLVDDRSIDELYRAHVISANEWPLLYRDHGILLDRIARYRPRAVFVDVYFKKERSTDNTLEALLSRLQRSEDRYGTQFLFAGGYADEHLSPIQKTLSNLGPLSVNGWQGYGRAYPLIDAGRATVAYDLYRSACLGDAPLEACTRPLATASVDPPPLSVRWGGLPAPAALPEFVTEQCDAREYHLLDLLLETARGIANGLMGETGVAEGRVRCPYHTTIFAQDILHVQKSGSDEQQRRLAKLLNNRIVLYGVSLEGLHDTVVSPVHGGLPGVMLHAMALDNLLNFGAAYTRAGNEDLEFWNAWAWFLVVLCVSVVLLVIEIRTRRAVEVPWVEEKKRFIHPRLQLHLLGAGMVIVWSLFMFGIQNFEPLNSFGFLGLGALVAELIHSDASGKLISLMEKVRNYVLGRMKSIGWIKTGENKKATVRRLN